jgi:hypothetical protein
MWLLRELRQVLRLLMLTSLQLVASLQLATSLQLSTSLVLICTALALTPMASSEQIDTASFTEDAVSSSVPLRSQRLLFAGSETKDEDAASSASVGSTPP